jgi:hypothetical protein
MTEDEPIRTIRETTVETPDQYYKATSVEMYPNYVRIFTSRDQNHTEPEVWIPADSNVKIGAEHSDPY